MKKGRKRKHVNNAEKQKAYRRRKALKRIESGQIKGILNWTTGRVWKVK